MRSKTLRQAEKKALAGANESQDTLVIAHYLMKDYGVGLTSSSPPGSPDWSGPPSRKRSKKDFIHADNPPEEVSLLARPGSSPMANTAPAFGHGLH
ncbi:hypothetical protein VTI74DRAFT_4211 [Chaetomium olivicolor]